MKKIILIFSTIIFMGCQQPVDTDVIGVVKTSDEKTQRILSDLENYLAYGTDNYDAESASSLISDSFQGNFAVQTITAEDFVSTAEIHNSLFDNIQMGLPGSDIIGGLQTVYYDELGTWSHYWGQWSGTGKFTGNEVTQFIHLNWGWDDEGKVVNFNAQFDAGFFRDEIAAAEASSN